MNQFLYWLLQQNTKKWLKKNGIFSENALSTWKNFFWKDPAGIYLLKGNNRNTVQSYQYVVDISVMKSVQS